MNCSHLFISGDIIPQAQLGSRSPLARARDNALIDSLTKTCDRGEVFSSVRIGVLILKVGRCSGRKISPGTF